MARVKWGAGRHWGTFKWGGDTVTLSIGGVPVTAPWGNLRIDETLSSEGATMNVEIVGSNAVRPVENQEVSLYEPDNFTGTDKLIFSGRITAVESPKTGASEFIHSIEARDWHDDVNRHLVLETYSDMHPSAILADLQTKYAPTYDFSTYCTGIDGTYISLMCRYEPVGEVIRRLCDIIRKDFFFDYHKRLHLLDYTNVAEDAPMQILDAGTEFDEFVLSTDAANMKNKITVRGGMCLSPTAHYQTVVVTAGQTTFNLKYVPHSPDLSVSPTPGYVGRTLGLQNVDTGKEFYYNQKEKIVVVGSYNGGSFIGGEYVTISYYYEIPVLVQVRDEASISNLKSLEGTGSDGLREGYLEDKSLVTLTDARLRGNAELWKYANVTVSSTFKTTARGLAAHFKPGQKVRVILTDRGINDTYLVFGVSLRYVNLNCIEQDVKIATYLRGYNDALRQALWKRDYTQNNEVLDHLSVIGETATPADVTVTEALRHPPFKWGPDANALIWNEGEWS